MGVIKGSSTYTRFQVEGSEPSNFIEQFERAIEIRRFVPLHPEGEDTDSMGWVLFQKPFADDEPILNDAFLFGQTIVLGYREDNMTYPKALIKDLVKKRLDEYQEKNQSEASFQIKKTIEASVVSELRKRILPRSKVVDCVWDLTRHEVRFFARGKGIVDRFVSFFEQSFGLKLFLTNFSELAVRAQLSLMEKSLLEHLETQEIFKMTASSHV